MWKETSSSPEIRKAAHVVGDDRVVGAEHRAQRMRALLGDLDAIFVEVVAEDVDAVRAGEVVEDVAVESVTVTPDDDSMKAPTPRFSRTSALYWNGTR